MKTARLLQTTGLRLLCIRGQILHFRQRFGGIAELVQADVHPVHH